MDTAIIAHPTTWVASGHVGWFSDALIDDKKTGQRFRADKIIENYIEKVRNNTTDQELAKNLEVPNLSPESRGNEGMYNFISQFIPNNPDTKKPAERTECRNFNLMLNTTLGPVADDANKVYLRPETCQSLFTDFRNVCDTTRNRIPFGMAQIGKAFRNEITPGQFLFRTREFEQMEIEYFVPADRENAMIIFEKRKQLGMKFWTEVIWVPEDKLRYKDHDKLAHYAAAATDIEFLFPRWFGEIQGIHNRTDFDLKQHQEYSKTSMQYTDPKSGQRYIPRCIESSMGLGRCVMVSMLAWYDEEVISKEDGSSDTRVVVRFPFNLAPIKYAIMPLVEKSDEMVALSKKIGDSLRKQWFQIDIDTSGGIGKRYRRQDEIGTPYCICVDHESIEINNAHYWTVTIRKRDTMDQVRVKREEISNFR